MIRQASLEDIETVLDLGRRFHAYSPWSERASLNEDHWRQTAHNLLTGETSAIFLSEDGFCGGLIFPLYFNWDYLIAQELFWFAKSGGTEVRQAFENWAKGRGAVAIQMSCLADKREAAMRRLLTRKGYVATETQLLRELV